MPRDRTSPLDSATATAIVSAWTSRPINRTFFMTGSLRMWLCVEASTRSVTHELRIDAGGSMLTHAAYRHEP